MRAFRDFLKHQFMDTYGSRYYYWILPTVREKTKEFFLSDKFDFDKNIYAQNEFVFIRLIHNAKKGDKTS